MLFGGNYTQLFTHFGEGVCLIVVFACSMLDGIVKGHNQLLVTSDLLAVRGSFYDGEKGFVSSQNYKLVFCQLSFKTAQAVDPS